IVVIVTTLLTRRHLVKVWSEVLNPSVVRPNGGLVTANGSNVKLPRIRGDILSNFRTQIIFGQGHEVDLDVGVVLFKNLLRQLLHLHHLRVVDGADSQDRSAARLTLAGITRGQ